MWFLFEGGSRRPRSGAAGWSPPYHPPHHQHSAALAVRTTPNNCSRKVQTEWRAGGGGDTEDFFITSCFTQRARRARRPAPLVPPPPAPPLLLPGCARAAGRGRAGGSGRLLPRSLLEQEPQPAQSFVCCYCFTITVRILHTVHCTGSTVLGVTRCSSCPGPPVLYMMYFSSSTVGKPSTYYHLRLLSSARSITTSKKLLRLKYR